MSKRKHDDRPQAGGSPSSRQLGLSAWRQHNYTEAIQRWSAPQNQNDPVVRPALAEAHFRRALEARLQLPNSLADLRQATELVPNEGRFWYHYGLALHRADQVEAACAAYARAGELGLARRGFGFVRGLAELERARRAGGEPGQRLLEAMTWLPEDDRTALMPIAALLGGAPQTILAPAPAGWLERLKATVQGDSAAALWQGLAWLATGEAAQALARLTLPKGQQMRTGAEIVRLFYRGVAAAASAQPQAAQNDWTAAARLAARANWPGLPRVSQKLAGLQWQSARELMAAGRWAEVLTQAQAALALTPNEEALLRLSLVAHNRLAQSAVAAEDWPAASTHWQAMDAILQGHTGLGPRSPLLRNIASAHEQLEHWAPAAEAWAALLATLPRRSAKKKPVVSGPPTEELRAWLRRRILDNYQRAGQPGQAITYYKQAVKAAPDDLDLRLELASALLANEQEIAARNEVQRILDKDAAHLGALLLLAEIHLARDEWYAAEQALRSVLAIDPQHEAARRELAQAMRDRGVEAFNSGHYPLARTIYMEALTFAPADAEVLVFLAETEWMLGNKPAARAHYETALASGKPDAYVLVFESWLDRGQADEARQVLERAERSGVATAQMYVDMGVACLTRGAPPPALPQFFGPAPARTAAKAKWEDWGHELIERGLANAPKRAEVLRYLIAQMGVQQPALGQEYARQLAALEPQDASVLMTWGVMQALSQDTAAAKDTLRKAEQLARKQGKPDLVRDIAKLRQEISSPMFGMLAPLLASLSPEMLDAFDDEDDFEFLP